MLLGEAEQAKRFEPWCAHSLLNRSVAGQAPPSFAREGREPRGPSRHAVSNKEVGDGFGAFAVLEPDATQLSADPSVELIERSLALSMAVIHQPACSEAIHFKNHFVEGDTAVTSRDPSQAVLEPFQAFGRNTHRPVSGQAVAEEAEKLAISVQSARFAKIKGIDGL